MEVAEAVLIRAYEPRDREAVRQLCCETADLGKPIERFFDDREIAADLLTRYYTAYEPRSLVVAESAGRVVGYVTGCLDSRRYWRLMAQRVIPRAFLRSLLRGTWCSAKTWRLVRIGVTVWLVAGRRRDIPLERYPAHLHINLRPEVRGHGVGRLLVERFLDQARAAGASGAHVAVSEENPLACRFFERLAFQPLGRYPMIRPKPGVDQRTWTRIYGKTL